MMPKNKGNRGSNRLASKTLVHFLKKSMGEKILAQKITTASVNIENDQTLKCITGEIFIPSSGFYSLEAQVCLTKKDKNIHRVTKLFYHLKAVDNNKKETRGYLYFKK